MRVLMIEARWATYIADDLRQAGRAPAGAGARQCHPCPLLNESASINNLASWVNDSARRLHHIARQGRSPQRMQAGSGRVGRRTPRAGRLCLRQGKRIVPPLESARPPP